MAPSSPIAPEPAPPEELSENRAAQGRGARRSRAPRSRLKRATLRLTADPPAEVTIEGEGVTKTLTTPVRALSLRAGTYRVTFRNATYGPPVATRVSLSSGRAQVVHADFREAEPARHGAVVSDAFASSPVRRERLVETMATAFARLWERTPPRTGMPMTCLGALCQELGREPDALLAEHEDVPELVANVEVARGGVPAQQPDARRRTGAGRQQSPPPRTEDRRAGRPSRGASNRGPPAALPARRSENRAFPRGATRRRWPHRGEPRCRCSEDLRLDEHHFEGALGALGAKPERLVRLVGHREGGA